MAKKTKKRWTVAASAAVGLVALGVVGGVLAGIFDQPATKNAVNHQTNSIPQASKPIKTPFTGLSFTSTPQNQTVDANSLNSISLSYTISLQNITHASGDVVFTLYQTGAKTATKIASLTQAITNTQASVTFTNNNVTKINWQAGSYYVVATYDHANQHYSVTSHVTTISVIGSFGVNLKTNTTTIYQNGSTTIYATASNVAKNATVTYSWNINGKTVNNAASNSFVFKNYATSNTPYIVTCTATETVNGQAFSTSASVNINVAPLPVTTLKFLSTNQTVYKGSSIDATFLYNSPQFNNNLANLLITTWLNGTVQTLSGQVLANTNLLHLLPNSAGVYSLSLKNITKNCTIKITYTNPQTKAVQTISLNITVTTQPTIELTSNNTTLAAPLVISNASYNNTLNINSTVINGTLFGFSQTANQNQSFSAKNLNTTLTLNGKAITNALSTSVVGNNSWSTMIHWANLQSGTYTLTASYTLVNGTVVTKTATINYQTTILSTPKMTPTGTQGKTQLVFSNNALSSTLLNVNKQLTFTLPTQANVNYTVYLNGVSLEPSDSNSQAFTYTYTPTSPSAVNIQIIAINKLMPLVCRNNANYTFDAIQHFTLAALNKVYQTAYVGQNVNITGLIGAYAEQTNNSNTESYIYTLSANGTVIFSNTLNNNDLHALTKFANSFSIPYTITTTKTVFVLTVTNDVSGQSATQTMTLNAISHPTVTFSTQPKNTTVLSTNIVSSNVTASVNVTGLNNVYPSVVTFTLKNTSTGQTVAQKITTINSQNTANIVFNDQLFINNDTYVVDAVYVYGTNNLSASAISNSFVFHIVNVPTVNISTQQTLVYCKNNVNITSTINNKNNSNGTYSWLVNGNQVATSTNFTFNEDNAGTYTVQLVYTNTVDGLTFIVKSNVVSISVIEAPNAAIAFLPNTMDAYVNTPTLNAPFYFYPPADQLNTGAVASSLASTFANVTLSIENNNVNIPEIIKRGWLISTGEANLYTLNIVKICQSLGVSLSQTGAVSVVLTYTNASHKTTTSDLTIYLVTLPTFSQTNTQTINNVSYHNQLSASSVQSTTIKSALQHFDLNANNNQVVNVNNLTYTFMNTTTKQTLTNAVSVSLTNNTFNFTIDWNSFDFGLLPSGKYVLSASYRLANGEATKLASIAQIVYTNTVLNTPSIQPTSKTLTFAPNQTSSTTLFTNQNESFTLQNQADVTYNVSIIQNGNSLTVTKTDNAYNFTTTNTPGTIAITITATNQLDAFASTTVTYYFSVVQTPTISNVVVSQNNNQTTHLITSANSQDQVFSVSANISNLVNNINTVTFSLVNVTNNSIVATKTGYVTGPKSALSASVVFPENLLTNDQTYEVTVSYNYDTNLTASAKSSVFSYTVVTLPDMTLVPSALNIYQTGTETIAGTINNQSVLNSAVTYTYQFYINGVKDGTPLATPTLILNKFDNPGTYLVSVQPIASVDGVTMVGKLVSAVPFTVYANPSVSTLHWVNSTDQTGLYANDGVSVNFEYATTNIDNLNGNQFDDLSFVFKNGSTVLTTLQASNLFNDNGVDGISLAKVPFSQALYMLNIQWQNFVNNVSNAKNCQTLTVDAVFHDVNAVQATQSATLTLDILQAPIITINNTNATNNTYQLGRIQNYTNNAGNLSLQSKTITCALPSFSTDNSNFATFSLNNLQAVLTNTSTGKTFNENISFSNTANNSTYPVFSLVINYNGLTSGNYTLQITYKSNTTSGISVQPITTTAMFTYHVTNEGLPMFNCVVQGTLLNPFNPTDPSENQPNYIVYNRQYTMNIIPVNSNANYSYSVSYDGVPLQGNVQDGWNFSTNINGTTTLVVTATNNDYPSLKTTEIYQLQMDNSTLTVPNSYAGVIGQTVYLSGIVSWTTSEFDNVLTYQINNGPQVNVPAVDLNVKDGYLATFSLPFKVTSPSETITWDYESTLQDLGGGTIQQATTTLTGAPAPTIKFTNNNDIVKSNKAPNSQDITFSTSLSNVVSGYNTVEYYLTTKPITNINDLPSNSTELLGAINNNQSSVTFDLVPQLNVKYYCTAVYNYGDSGVVDAFSTTYFEYEQLNTTVLNNTNNESLAFSLNNNLFVTKDKMYLLRN